MSVTVEVTPSATGIDQNLLRDPTLKDRINRDIYRRALLVERKAKRLCPVDTGRLRSSITTETTASTTDEGFNVVTVGTDVEYAGYVHDGTRYMRARPFLLDALDAAR